jgi:acetate kinase
VGIVTTTPSPGACAAGADAGSIVLALNSGSSSLKFGLYRVDASGADMLLTGEAEAIGEERGVFHVEDGSGGTLVSEAATLPSQRDAVARISAFLTTTGMPPPAAVGHRIVHGGPRLRQHCLVDEEVFSKLEAAAAFAPVHMPPALAVIAFAKEHFAGVPQVACFDTAFHSGLPDIARTLPIPKALRAEGVQRYGFHGLSCESIVRQLGNEVPRRLIIAHLGNGASVTAVKDGKSIDTSMGLTPSGGVIMGTRSGDLDPGVLTYLAREKSFDAAMLEELVDHRSGLLGLSGTDSDMRRLREAASSNADARLAIEMFCYSVRKQIAAMIAALGGIDLLVFTGGIGETDARARAVICGSLSWFDISLDEGGAGSAGDPTSEPRPRCQVRALPSREDDQIVLHTWALALHRRP